MPFLPLRGIIGSDLVKHRPDWKTVDNPMGNGGDPILLIPAIRPDVALFHAPMADREGNVWIGRRRELATIAHASKTTLVTVERMYDGSFFDDERLAAGALPAFYIQAVAVAEKGAAPVGMALIDWTGELADFADTAALATALDLVITVDTAVAHLAGALGRPVWLLNRFDADWRWLRGRDDSPWYPTLRQFRQAAPGDWHDVVRRVAAALAAP